MGFAQQRTANNQAKTIRIGEEVEVTCPICGGRNAGIVLSLKRDGQLWDIHKCGYCLTQFIYPIPSDEELGRLYTDYYANGEGSVQLEYPSYGRLSFPRQWGIIKSIVKKREGKILDFGCGGGHFLGRVSKDWQKYGVEISDVARTIAEKKGITTFESLDSLEHWDNFFDAIVIFATIEHLPNPKEVVVQLSKLLKVGGLFVVMTGDVGSVKAKMQGERWHLYTPPGHIYFFTAHAVDYLMESLGFKKVKHLYTDGGVTSIPFVPLNLALRIGLEAYFRLPMLNRLPLWDTYYGYYRKE